MSRIKKFTALLLTVMMLVSFIPQTAFAASGWAKEGTSWIYVTNGKRATGWKKIGGKWYFFNPGGIMMSGCAVSEDFKTYYFVGSDGAMKTKAGWYKSSWGSWVYAKTGGKLYSDCWKKISGKWYCFDGAYMQHDTEVDGYYLNSSGAMVVNKWIKVPYRSYEEVSNGQYEWVDKNAWSYYGSDGKKAIGWKKISSVSYCFDWKGWMLEDTVVNEDGLYQPKGNLYSYAVAGKGDDEDFIESARQQNYYYVDSKGVMKTTAGWVTTGNRQYYVYSGGVLARGWTKLDGKWYYFSRAFGRLITEDYCVYAEDEEDYNSNRPV